MSLTSRFLNTITRRAASRDEIAEELLFHLEEKTAANLDAGMDPARARESAMKSFGNKSVLGDAMRDVDVIQWLDNVRRDLVHAARGLSRRRGLVATAVLSLALGIGSSTALFSVADAVLLRPLPFPHPERLLAILESKRGESSNSNPARMRDWAAQAPGLEAVGGYYGEGLVLTGEGPAVRLQALRVVGRFFDVLGVAPVAGRLFTREEQESVGEPATVLSESFWRRRYHGDRAILGRVLRLNGAGYTVVGVVPGDFRFPDPIDAITPAPPSVRDAPRKAGFLSLAGRRKADASLKRVQGQLAVVARRLAQEFPATDRERGVEARPLQTELGEDARDPLLLLLAASGLVLAIACVNVASLLLSRALERQRESAIRMSLGAGRGALIRLYLAESLVISAMGGAAGLLAGRLALSGLLHLLPLDFPLLSPPRYDERAAAFAVTLSILSGFLFGWAPAWQAATGRLTESYRATAGRSALWVRRGLVVAQVAFSVVLLVAVGLAAKRLYAMRAAPVGVNAGGVLTAQVNFSWDTPETRLDDYANRVLENLAHAPGVAAAGMIDRLPLHGATQTGPISVAGRDLPADLRERPVDQRAVKGDYFEAAGVPLIQGRYGLRPGEAVVNQTLARRYFLDGGAIGRRISTDSRHVFTIVGVSGDVRVDGTQAAQPAEMFIRSEETYWPLQNYVVRAVSDPAGVVSSVREAFQRADANQPITRLATMSAALEETSLEQSTRVWLLGSFGAMALILAGIGLYGVLASDVVQSRPELAIRLALGAQPGRILSGTVGRGVLLVAIGLGIGILVAVWLEKLHERMVLGVGPGDPLVFLAVAAILLATGAGASLIPALRAARIDPAETLKAQC